MERIWLKSYPPGVPAEIDTHQYRSLVELFEKSIRAYGDRPAFTSMGKTLSFSELDTLARNFGAWLQAKGVAKGARVALMMPNCLQYPVAMFGTLRAGCVVVNVNPLYTARELEHQVNDAGAEVIGVSSDSAASHHSFATRHRLPFILLSDALGAVRKRYGVPTRFGLLPGRVTYIIDKQGIIRHIFSAQFTPERHITEALKTLQALSQP